MSEPVTRQRPSIDLDDFERRLDASHAGHEDDPLAELARLVGEHRDPYENVFAQEAVARAPHDFAAHREPQFAPPRGAGLPANFAAIEAGLRGSLPAGEEPTYGHDRYAGQDQYAGHDPYALQHDGHDYPADQAAEYGFQPEVARPGGSRRPAYLIAATIAVGVLGVGVAFALKGHGTSPSDVRTIMAAAGPTKIQPPAQDSADPSAQDSAILGKGAQAQPTKVVSNTEEPVDVGAAVQNASGTGPTDAASVPVPPAPGQADGSAGATPATDFAMGMPAPKKVKVVSVRPDGTILSDDQPAAASTSPDTSAAAQSPAADAKDTPAPVAKASTPKAATPKPVNAPKMASRVMPKRVADAVPADAAADAPMPKAAHKARPQKLAMTEPADTAPAASDENAKGSGGFAVQLAAPGSEDDARAASSKLAHKYASALDGHHLGFHKALSNGRSVFRVRVSSLSKGEAQSLCEKLKADGGTCFVAKN